ncbi:zinc finger FYVE domain-containing protein 9 isoform X1 [Paramormyrops kingsleyae]|uniref:zinc finger FYVE domain-containing protein 9 isoform X1 n=2 Tax=Paramormyrops kingsleyae TaxID=1676925 RepID=UPI003B978805
MENYFQAEAFNLDKVLDEFEQNEDEADAPTLSDAKWTQILAPPSHLLSFSPALAHADLSPLNLKPPPESPGGPAGDLSMTGSPDTAADERPPAQPNIGKLVGVDSLENGAPPSPALNGCAKGSLSDDGPHQVDDPPCCAGSPPADDVAPPESAESYFKDSYFSLEDGGGSGDLPSASADPSEPPEHSSIIGSPKGEHNLEVPAQPEVHADPEGQPEMVTNGGTAETSAANQSEELEGEFSTCAVPNGLEAPEPGPRCPRGPPSKEEFVTEEKEVEESKQECSEQARGPETGATLGREDGRQQPVSVPYGGARPKQPAGLKLQIPRSLLGHNQSQSHPQDQLGPQGKNKNQDPRGQPGEASCPHGYGEQPSLNGERASSGPSGPVMAPESPDNDIQAGHLGALSRKPFSSLGEVAPVWVPDSQAPVCMKCEAKFTFTKRRHHCRACGKVFCAACCSLKCRLMYMDRKEARVCVTCHSALMTAQSWENASGGNAQTPNPNNPAEYCSTVPPLQQARASGALSSPPPTVMVPVGVLKHPGTEGSLPREQRRVWFADGILPNGEVADSTKVAVTSPPPSGPLLLSQDSGKPATAGSSEAVPPPAETAPPAPSHGLGAPVGSPVGSSVNLIPDDGLPPILISTGVKGDYAVEERPSEILMMQQLEEGTLDPLVFVLNANLLAMVKLVNYVNRKCWCVTTKGMHAVGQAEVVVLLQCLPDEKSIPRDIFSHFVQLYREALTGNVVTHLGHSFFTQSFLGSREHGGFLYISPTFQSLQDLLLPNPPYLFGILIQKWETPWAKVFPIRLMLRLGAEYRFYPCPLFSVRFRKPLFGETGHTIMNLLADFRNYQYTLPVVTGLVVDLEVRRTCIKIPSNRYNELMKAMNKSNEHVLAIGAYFNERADSHLVCVQNDDGNYQTQAISIHNQPRKVTGACFFVFSGALKVSSGYLAKSSIVEDGVMVQITAETMEALRQALREMKDFTITCGKADQQESQEHVYIQWLEDDRNFNKGVISPIDGRSMESITSVKIFHGSEYKANGKVIRWTEVFFLQSDDQSSGLSDPADHSRLTENMARAFCVALCPHLKLLKEDGLAKLGLRVTLDSDQVGYLAGSNGQPLLSQYMNDLDSALVPVIHSGACQISEGPVVIELIFYILENIS